ncbi:MAG: DUF6913 domain-containing protein [Bacteroidales bacterium]
MKRFLLRQRIRRILKKKREHAAFMGYQEVRTIQLIYQTSDREAVLRFEAELRSEGKSVKLIEISESEDPKAEHMVISRRSFSFTGELNTEQRKEIEASATDLLIDLIPRVRYREIAVVLLSKATFKVGIHKENYPIYDFNLLIDEKMHPDALIDKIKFYIRIIKAK